MPTDNAEKIAEIEAILREGASRVVVDGVVIEYDFASLERQLSRLKRADEASNGRIRRPTFLGVNLGGEAWPQ